jgi:hypothetical protein
MKLHALLGYPVSEIFVSWCQTLKNSSTSFLCIQETYSISTISQFESDSKMCTVLAPVFAHPVSSLIRIVHVKIAKSLEKLRWRLLVCED